MIKEIMLKLSSNHKKKNNNKNNLNDTTFIPTENNKRKITPHNCKKIQVINKTPINHKIKIENAIYNNSINNINNINNISNVYYCKSIQQQSRNKNFSNNFNKIDMNTINNPPVQNFIKRNEYNRSSSLKKKGRNPIIKLTFLNELSKLNIRSKKSCSNATNNSINNNINNNMNSKVSILGRNKNNKNIRKNRSSYNNNNYNRTQNLTQDVFKILFQ